MFGPGSEQFVNFSFLSVNFVRMKLQFSSISYYPTIGHGDRSVRLVEFDQKVIELFRPWFGQQLQIVSPSLVMTLTLPTGDMGFCPTLKRCLFHQACVFRFGNEFCLHDPTPGVRKVGRFSVVQTPRMHFTSRYRLFNLGVQRATGPPLVLSTCNTRAPPQSFFWGDGLIGTTPKI